MIESYIIVSFFLYSYSDHLDLHSFPTRRSSDLVKVFFPNQDDRGAHINISGGGIVKNAPHKEYAIKLLEFRSEEHTSELRSQSNLVCRLLLEKKNTQQQSHILIRKIMQIPHIWC